MPQVRIRNVSNEYKLVAGVFSPELLHLEERWGKTDPVDAYQMASNSTSSKPKLQSHRKSNTVSRDSLQLNLISSRQDL